MDKDKFAYLILSHNEFDILSKLIECLDDVRNDIYVHIDKKVRDLPSLQTKKSKLQIIENRVDARWGDISLIKAEYALFEAAYAVGGYSRYILLSGVHMPIKSQDYIHNWLNEKSNVEIMAPVPNSESQTALKMHRYNFFTKQFANSILAQKLWHLGIFIQEKLQFKRNIGSAFHIASQWVCLTNAAVKCLIENKNKALKLFKFTFCCDEFFVRTMLEIHGFEPNIVITDDLLYCDFNGKASPRTLTMADYDFMINSEYLFARKFSIEKIDVVDKICNSIVPKI